MSIFIPFDPRCGNCHRKLNYDGTTDRNGQVECGTCGYWTIVDQMKAN